MCRGIWLSKTFLSKDHLYGAAGLPMPLLKGNTANMDTKDPDTILHPSFAHLNSDSIYAPLNIIYEYASQLSYCFKLHA